MVLVLFDSCKYESGNLRHGIEVIGGTEGGAWSHKTKCVL
jgi:hypothetical protein